MCLSFNMLAVHGHGGGKRLGTCLVLQPGASGVVSLQHVPKFHFASCERLNMLVVHGHGRCKSLGTCLVLELRASCVTRLQHVPMFEYASCARAWTRYAPQYMPSVCYVCCGHSCV